MKLNGKIMLEKMADVDEGLILGAENTQISETDIDTQKKAKKKFFITGAAVTAVMAAAAIAVTFVPWRSDNHVILPDLPMLTVSGVSDVVGFGFSAIGAEALEKHKESLPEQNFEISEMPVYNSSSVSADTSDKMKAKLKEAAEYFGLNLDSLDISDNTMDEKKAEDFKKYFKKEYGDVPDEELERMVRQQRIHGDICAYQRNDDDPSGISYISVSSDMCVSIHFKERKGPELPADFNFTDGSTPEELEAAGRYLLGEYGELINMNDPVYEKYSEHDGTAEFYENGAYPAESIANQSIKHVQLIGENNRLKIIRIYDEYTLCDKIADYPIITEKEAEKLLRNGNFLSTIDSEMYTLKEDDEIGLTMLTYRSGIGYECIMPFYLFYVRLPGEEFGHEEGEDIYGLFYVPAVKGEYLENMPDPAISFNGGMIK